MMRVFCLVLLLLGALPAAATTLTVSAASSLSESFRAIASAYEKTHAGVRVDLNFAASGVLLQQVTRGAPVDVFASADRATLDQAERAGLLLTGSRQVFARNTLWVVVPPRTVRPPRRLQDLAGSGVQRLAVGNPDSVPVGRYAQQALRRAGLWPAVEGRVIRTQNVRQSLDYVARGEVDAGFVYATDVKAMSTRVSGAFEVPVEGGIAYPLAVVKHSGHPDEARRFIQFVRSAQGQAILRRHGFSAP